MTAFITAVAAASLWFVFAIWSKASWLNMALKMFFLVISLATTVEALKAYGMVILP